MAALPQGSTSSLGLQQEGRRLYVTGPTYPIREQLRDAGCHWDGDRKQWWIGTTQRSAIEALVASAPAASPPAASPRTERQAPGLEATVAGRVEYKGRTYYLAGRAVRGRTHWDDGVAPIETRDGAKVLLYSRDGQLQFWAARALVTVQRTYRRAQSIQALREYAEEARRVTGGARLEDGYYIRDGEVLASGCGECARLGRMCRSCQHDYE